MNHANTRRTRTVLAAVIALALPLGASADAGYDALKSQVEALQKQLQQVQETLQQYEQQTVTREEIHEIRQEVAAVSTQQSEWKNTDSVVHLAGYGDVTYSDGENQEGAFGSARFNPIFHYQYKDLVMLEGELEVEVEDDGATDLALEYLTVDLFVNDYLALVAGKYLSPLGQFRQNLHPSWINKLPTAPSGFGHDQAAVVSEMGLQARGGFPLGNQNVNYAVYIGNGPILEIEGGTLEIEAVEAEGRSGNDDGKFVYGGRVGVTPWANSEIGVSLATGEISGEVGGVPEPSATRDYDVYGADFAFKWKDLGLRSEYIKQKVGTSVLSAAPGSAAWDAWYAQAAWRFMPTGFEGVLRYSDYDANLDEFDQKQWAIGINYLFAPNAMAKVAYNFNDGMAGEPSDDDQFQIQFAYGF